MLGIETGNLVHFTVVRYAVLGALFIALAVVSDGVYALLARTAGERLRRLRESGRALARASGGIYIGLGVLAALCGDRPAK